MGRRKAEEHTAKEKREREERERRAAEERAAKEKREREERERRAAEERAAKEKREREERERRVAKERKAGSESGSRTKRSLWVLLTLLACIGIVLILNNNRGENVSTVVLGGQEQIQNETQLNIVNASTSSAPSDQVQEEKGKQQLVAGDVSTRIKSDRHLKENKDTQPPAVVDIGANIMFGRYMQGRNGEQASIEWLVLSKDQGKYLLLSKYGLDCKRFHNKSAKITWEQCDLRRWLNNDFYNKAFNINEKEKIVQVRNQNPKNFYHGTDGGNPTLDKVFLLSIDEAKRYFKDDSARQCQLTRYAQMQSTITGDNGNGWWWLRSPGSKLNNAAGINPDGVIRDVGHRVYGENSFVRPAIWISNL